MTTAIGTATTSRHRLTVKDRVNGLKILLTAEIVTRAQDRISASHTDPPREAKQNPANYLARNIYIPGLKLCSILGRSLLH